jgi:hypothetical protein
MRSPLVIQFGSGNSYAKGFAGAPLHGGGAIGVCAIGFNGAFFLQMTRTFL